MNCDELGGPACSPFGTHVSLTMTRYDFRRMEWKDDDGKERETLARCVCCGWPGYTTQVRIRKFSFLPLLSIDFLIWNCSVPLLRHISKSISRPIYHLLANIRVYIEPALGSHRYSCASFIEDSRVNVCIHNLLALCCLCYNLCPVKTTQHQHLSWPRVVFSTYIGSTTRLCPHAW